MCVWVGEPSSPLPLSPLLSPSFFFLSTLWEKPIIETDNTRRKTTSIDQLFGHTNRCGVTRTRRVLIIGNKILAHQIAACMYGGGAAAFRRPSLCSIGYRRCVSASYCGHPFGAFAVEGQANQHRTLTKDSRCRLCVYIVHEHLIRHHLQHSPKCSDSCKRVSSAYGRPPQRADSLPPGCLIHSRFRLCVYIVHEHLIVRYADVSGDRRTSTANRPRLFLGDHCWHRHLCPPAQKKSEGPRSCNKAVSKEKSAQRSSKSHSARCVL